MISGIETTRQLVSLSMGQTQEGSKPVPPDNEQVPRPEKVESPGLSDGENALIVFGVGIGAVAVLVALGVSLPVAAPIVLIGAVACGFSSSSGYAPRENVSFNQDKMTKDYTPYKNIPTHDEKSNPLPREMNLERSGKPLSHLTQPKFDGQREPVRMIVVKRDSNADWHFQWETTIAANPPDGVAIPPIFRLGSPYRDPETGSPVAVWNASDVTKSADGTFVSKPGAMPRRVFNPVDDPIKIGDDPDATMTVSCCYDRKYLDNPLLWPERFDENCASFDIRNQELGISFSNNPADRQWLMHHLSAKIPDRVFRSGAACVLRWTDRSGNDIPGSGKPLQLMKIDYLEPGECRTVPLSITPHYKASTIENHGGGIIALNSSRCWQMPVFEDGSHTGKVEWNVEGEDGTTIYVKTGSFCEKKMVNGEEACETILDAPRLKVNGKVSCHQSPEGSGQFKLVADAGEERKCYVGSQLSDVPATPLVALGDHERLAFFCMVEEINSTGVDNQGNPVFPQGKWPLPPEGQPDTFNFKMHMTYCAKSQ